MSYRVAENSGTGSNFAHSVSIRVGSLYSTISFGKIKGLLMEVSMCLTHVQSHTRLRMFSCEFTAGQIHRYAAYNVIKDVSRFNRLQAEEGFST